MTVPRPQPMSLPEKPPFRRLTLTSFPAVGAVVVVAVVVVPAAATVVVVEVDAVRVGGGYPNT